MKKIKVVALALVIVMLCGVLGSCGSEKVIANVKVLIVAGDDTILNNVEIPVEGTPDNPPTVLQAFQEACIQYEIAYTLDSTEKSVSTISTYADVEDESGAMYFWEYSIMTAGTTAYAVPKAGSGKAADNVINDGDAIKYTYMVQTLVNDQAQYSEYVTPDEDAAEETTAAE